MDEKEQIEKLFREELARNLKIDEIIDLPITINIEEENIENIERWRNNE